MSTAKDNAYNVDISDQHAPIIVNLRAQVDASATVNVFGPSEEVISNVLWCTVPLDISGLYSDPSNALIEFWEPSDAPRGTINARIARTTRNARNVAQVFAESLAKVLVGAIDASAANPFQGYSGRTYTDYSSFGELVVSYAAEQMFGHPSATAAITNDKDIVDGFNNDDRVLESVTDPVPPLETDQALAQRLGAALYDTGDDIATLIARQVLGQDASRATNVDNSALQNDKKAPLRFYPNDIVYVAIRLTGFVPSVGSPSGAFYQQYIANIRKPTDETYYLRIRLDANTQ